MPFPPNQKFSEVNTTTEPNRSVPPKKKKASPPPRPPKVAKGKAPSQPSNPPPNAQASAVPPSSPQQTVPPPTGRAPPMGAGETQGAVDRSSHFPGNPGFAEGRHEKNQDYHAEQKEHWGDKASGGGDKGGVSHASQPSGHPIGVPPLGSGQQGSFGKAHTFSGMRGNPTPSSGHPGAHRIGKR